ncbi:MAG: hypothetical protein J7M20_02325 [Deltaproteobacteria bacterium]|nr:hypothetical protein [Deltaproteobacteria bacterium]
MPTTRNSIDRAGKDKTHDPGEDLLARMARESPDLLRRSYVHPQDGA